MYDCLEISPKMAHKDLISRSSHSGIFQHPSSVGDCVANNTQIESPQNNVVSSGFPLIPLAI